MNANPYKGQAVILNTPDNTQLHGSACRVRVVTSWGAFLDCPNAATGVYRAHFTEMAPAEADTSNGHLNGSAPQSPSHAIASGYTGDCCHVCGGMRMRRNGACLVCDDCGTSGGCG